MGLIDDCKQYFGSDDLYTVLDVSRESTSKQIQSAYRKVSLRVHPDRADDNRKDVATRAFQTLSKVHYILSTKQLRETYDESGFVFDEQTIESSADWQQYWRLLFPKISTKDIDKFIEKYVGSEQERTDLKNIYMRYNGDMDKIYESHIGFDEQRVRDLLTNMIESEELPQFDAFVNESKQKRDKRVKKLAKEAKMAEKQKKKTKNNGNDDDLVLAIQSRSKGNFDDMIASLEAKYSDANTKSRSNKKLKK